MTFRSRVIAATVGVAALAVVLACVASFIATRSALLRSVDESLLIQASHSSPRASGGDDSQLGSFFELVLANGQTTPTSKVPIDQTITDRIRARNSWK